MCGIAGIIRYREGAPVAAADLASIGHAQRHRGPDDSGHWISADGRTGFQHQRLAIIDLSPLGHQPMLTADALYCTCFNGEIYNYQSLRSELQGLGHHFVSTSDTEVLLHGYREWGTGLLDRLRGMFAFALYDAKKRETLLARDPLGIKPLYYSDSGSVFAFASEVQALKHVVDDHEIDPEGLAAFLSWGSIAPPRTLHRAIRALEPGSWIRVRADRVDAPKAYYHLRDAFRCAEDMSEEEASERIRSALVDSVSHHMIADVPVGAFLSGGVDSAALVGLMAEQHEGALRTITLAMDAADLDESDLARQAATLYETEHHEIPMTIENVRERMQVAIRALDQPSIDGINTYFVAEATAKAGLKVAVSGVGGDELFGGYETFKMIPRIEQARARLERFPGGGAVARAGAGALALLPRSQSVTRAGRVLQFGHDTAGAYYATRGLFSPHEVRALLAPQCRDAVEATAPVAELGRRVSAHELAAEERISALEFGQYLQCQLLRDTDATAMRHSLEVRTPLVDSVLLSAVTRVPAGIRQAGPAKKWLRESPRPKVPSDLWARKKQGFTLPFDSWLRNGGLSTALPEHPCLDAKGVESLKRDFNNGKVTWSRLWSLIVLREYLS